MVTEVRDVETKAMTIVGQATSIKVVDGQSYLFAGEMWKRLAEMEKEAHEALDPVVKSTDRAHRDAVALRNKVIAPVENAKTYVKGQMSVYDTEQARIAEAERQRLQTLARKIEEDARLAEAVELEANGQKEEAEAVISEPIETPTIIVQKEVPKVAGGPVYRTVWDAEVFDFVELVRAVARGEVSYNALLPDKTFLRQQAMSMKETFNIPGVKAYSRRV